MRDNKTKPELIFQPSVGYSDSYTVYEYKTKHGDEFC